MTVTAVSPGLQTLLTLTGVAAVPMVTLIIFLLNRGPQLRQLKTTSDATLVTTAASLVATQLTQIEALDNKVTRLETELDTDRVAHTEQLTRAQRENARMAQIVAQLKTDLDITHRQIEELRSVRQARIQDNPSEGTALGVPDVTGGKHDRI